MNKVQVFILYASETGNCEQISEDFLHLLKTKYVKDCPLL